MSATLAVPGAVAGPRLATEKLRSALLWLTGLSGAFVFIEPSPYELVGMITMLVFMLTGLILRPGLAPLVLLILLLNVGYALSVIQVIDQKDPVIWVAVSAFLAGTAVFYAAMLGSNTEARLRWLLRGYLAAAMIASVVAVAAYFRLFGGGSETFLLYGRARGTFNDPNVLGAFLLLPGLLIIQRLLSGRLAALLGNSVLLLVLLAALLLSFSRGAWAQFAFATLVLLGLTFLTSRSLNERSRIIVIAAFGALLIVLFVAALLSIGQVADLFKERATLDQSYDLGRYGRFGRYSLGAELALDHPFGIGPLAFAKIYFPEDPHNTLLNSFMAGGWLGGFAFLSLTLVTLCKGLRFVFVATPWRPTYLVVYAAYLGVIAESMIVDVDHWRHYFLILGVLWGLMAVSQPYLRAPASRANAGLVPA